MTKTKRTLTAIAALLASAAATTAPAQEKITFALGTTVIDASQANNTSVPQHLNCWEDAGLDVEIQPSSSSAAVQALVTGGVDFNIRRGQIDPSELAQIRTVHAHLRDDHFFEGSVLQTDHLQHSQRLIIQCNSARVLHHIRLAINHQRADAITTEQRR